MSDITSRKGSTFPERSQYWRDVKREALELSHDQFQRHHEFIVAALSFLLMGYFRGWEEMVNELFTSLLYVAAPVTLYLVGLYVVNFIRAMVRVPVHYRQEINRLNETAQLKNQELQFEFVQFEFVDDPIERLKSVLFVATVRVKNPTAFTIFGVSVRIELIRKTKEIDQPIAAQTIDIFRKFPLQLRDDPTLPPRHEIDLHPGDDAVFNLVTIDRGSSGEWIEIFLHHTIGRKEDKGSWSQDPSGWIAPGRYYIQLKAQGRDVPAKPLSIEFEASSDEMWIRQVKEIPSLS